LSSIIRIIHVNDLRILSPFFHFEFASSCFPCWIARDN